MEFGFQVVQHGLGQSCSLRVTCLLRVSAGGVSQTQEGQASYDLPEVRLAHFIGGRPRCRRTFFTECHWRAFSGGHNCLECGDYDSEVGSPSSD